MHVRPWEATQGQAVIFPGPLEVELFNYLPFVLVWTAPEKLTLSLGGERDKSVHSSLCLLLWAELALGFQTGGGGGGRGPAEPLL